jgi:hypothetical protein
MTIMVYQAGDQQIFFDNGQNNPGDILQRKEAGGWMDFEVDGEVVKAPVSVYELPPGTYRLVVPDEK